MTVLEDVSAGGESFVNVGLIDLFWVPMKSFPKTKIKLALSRPYEERWMTSALTPVTDFMFC
jgi:hypothetical protein